MSTRLRLAAIALALLPTGCGGIRARVAPAKVAVRDQLERLNDLHRDPENAARALEVAVQAQPDTDGLLTLAERCLSAAEHVERRDANAARPWYRDAAVYAAFAAADAPEPASRLHNQAIEHLIRLARARPINNGRPWRETFADLSIVVTSSAPHLDPARLSDVQIARDFRVLGMQAYYDNSGLGVPLVPLRPNNRACPRVLLDRYFPEEFRPAATAVLEPAGQPAGGEWRQHPQALVLHDPFAERHVAADGRVVCLASDRTTPLAVERAWSPMKTAEFLGLFRPEAATGEAGLYLIQPYRPGKIPVVLVHGMHSSPDTWVQAINHLQNDPCLSERYQFWAFLYPTGDPLPMSAALLRRKLRTALEDFDPAGSDPALRQMVLVGHSMGGLLCKMMVQDSDMILWNAVLTEPPDALRVRPAVRDRLVEELIYQPEPYVRRVVFLATPHEGTRMAGRFLGRFVQVLMRPSQDINADLAEVAQSDGRQALAPGVRLRRINGIGDLVPSDPLLRAIERAGIDPSVPYDSIIPQIGTERFHMPTDGVVAYHSSHIEGAESEQITPGRHTAPENDVNTEALKRILRRHLESLP